MCSGLTDNTYISNPQVKGEGKGHQKTGREGPKEKYIYTLSLTSALDEVCG
jgi:hypothetical protein